MTAESLELCQGPITTLARKCVSKSQAGGYIEREKVVYSFKLLDATRRTFMKMGKCGEEPLPFSHQSYSHQPKSTAAFISQVFKAAG